MLLQDVERKSGDGDADADGVSVRDGVSRDRMLSVHDPELRHGHKSSRRRFNGHKAAIVVDTDSQLITAVDVLPGNAPDNLGALELVERSEVSTGSVVEEAMGDAAYGDGGTRQTSRRQSTSPSIPRLRNNSKRSMLCLTTVVLLGWVVVAIKDDAVVSFLLDRFFYTTSRYSTHRLSPLPHIHCLTGMATSLRCIRAYRPANIVVPSGRTNCCLSRPVLDTGTCRVHIF